MHKKKRTRLDIIIALFKFRKLFPRRRSKFGNKLWKEWSKKHKIPPINKILYKNLCG